MFDAIKLEMPPLAPVFFYFLVLNIRYFNESLRQTKSIFDCIYLALIEGGFREIKIYRFTTNRSY